MQKQSINTQEQSNTFTINDERDVVEFSASKFFLKPLVVANAIALTMTPISGSMSYGSPEKNIIVEQGRENDCSIYPTISLQYENGNVTNSTMISDQSQFPIQINSDIKKNTAEVRFQQIVDNLSEENAVLKNKLKNSFPTHIIIYLVGCSFVLGISITLLALTYLCNLTFINPYYVLCAILISLTLISTTIVASKDWKEYLNE